jgi:hypothetical protein
MPLIVARRDWQRVGTWGPWAARYPTILLGHAVNLPQRSKQHGVAMKIEKRPLTFAEDP